MRQVSHWHSSWWISSSKKSLGCCWNHFITTALTSSSDLNLQPCNTFLRGSHSWKSCSDRSRLYRRWSTIFQHMDCSISWTEHVKWGWTVLCNTTQLWAEWNLFSWWQYEGLEKVQSSVLCTDGDVRVLECQHHLSISVENSNWLEFCSVE